MFDSKLQEPRPVRSKLSHNVGGMASKGLRAITYQVTRKVEAGYNP